MKKYKKYKMLGRTPSAVLLVSDSNIYKVLDIESEVIYLGADKEKAKNTLKDYDIEEVRKERKRLFDEWLKENAEA